MMRSLLLTLILFAALALANDEPTCQGLIRDSVGYTQLAIAKAAENDWDIAFRANDTAFQSILKATSYCADDSESLLVVNTFFEEHLIIARSLACAYHSINSRRELSMAEMAVEHLGNYENGIYHASWSLYYTAEAVTRCAYDPERVELVEGNESKALRFIVTWTQQLEQE